MSIGNFFEFHYEFVQNRTKLQLDVYDHLSRDPISKLMNIGERLKEKIDEIVLGLINETRKYESMYLNNLQRETHEIEETHPLLIQSI